MSTIYNSHDDVRAYQVWSFALASPELCRSWETLEFSLDLISQHLLVLLSRAKGHDRTWRVHVFPVCCFDSLKKLARFSPITPIACWTHKACWTHSGGMVIFMASHIAHTSMCLSAYPSSVHPKVQCSPHVHSSLTGGWNRVIQRFTHLLLWQILNQWQVGS